MAQTDTSPRISGNPLLETRVALETLESLSQDAFERDTVHSLLANLKTVREQDWLVVPPGNQRSIADIVEHVAWAKWMYEDYAFGPATLRGDVPPLVPANGARSRPKEELVAWLIEGHSRWLTSVRALADDSELERERRANWGQMLTTGTLIRILIAHDWYHAGEVNHLRATLQNTDRWAYQD